MPSMQAATLAPGHGVNGPHWADAFTQTCSLSSVVQTSPPVHATVEQSVKQIPATHTPVAHRAPAEQATVAGGAVFGMPQTPSTQRWSPVQLASVVQVLAQPVPATQVWPVPQF